MSQGELIPLSQRVAAVVSGRALFTEKAQSYQVVAKLPIYIVAKVDGMAAMCGKSRTEVLSMLLSVALETVCGEMDDEAVERLVESEAEAYARLSGEAA